MKCLVCQKELDNPKAKFCSSEHKMKYRRDGGKTVTVDNRNSGFTPNWMVHGFKSKEEAIREAVKSVVKSEAVRATGLNLP